MKDQTTIACLQAFELLLRARASGLSREECAKFLFLLKILFQNI